MKLELKRVEETQDNLEDIHLRDVLLDEFTVAVGRVTGDDFGEFDGENDPWRRALAALEVQAEERAMLVAALREVAEVPLGWCMRQEEHDVAFRIGQMARAALNKIESKDR